MKSIPETPTNRRKAHSHVEPIVVRTDETATPVPTTPSPITTTKILFPGVKKNRSKDVNRTHRQILFRYLSTTSIDDSPNHYPTDALETDLSSTSDYLSPIAENDVSVSSSFLTDTTETDLSSESDYLSDTTETDLSSPDDDLINTSNAVLSLRKTNAPPAPALETPQATINANNVGLINDRNCPIDMSQRYVDNNGVVRSHQFLLPMIIKHRAMSSYRSSEMNWLCRFSYGMTRPRAVERFAAMARNQQPVRLINSQAQISVGQYHELADQFIDSLVDKLEGLEEQHEEIEVEFNSGVLVLTYLPHGVWVLNKQPANCQIWLSSPISGPFRFDYKEVESKNFADQRIKRGKWVDRNGVSLSALLERELQGVLDYLHLEGEDTKYNPKTERFEEINKN